MADAGALDALVQALRILPGVGIKSAQRMAFHLLQHDREGAHHKITFHFLLLYLT